MRKNNYNRFLISTCIAAVGLAMSAAPALAQDTIAAAKSESQADKDGNEIIVTAQRRSENAMKVPVSLTVIGAETLQERGITDLSAVSRLAPSLQSSQDNQFSIRGIGTSSYADTVESSVTQVIDDVVLGSRYFANIGFYDVQRVEVLNGPQGLLFGKNASAGVVNITTTPPALGETSGSFDVEGTSRYRDGKDGLGVRVRATANVPFGSNTALRLNATYSSQDSIVRFIQTAPGARSEADIEQYAFRAKFLTEPSDNLSIYLIGDYAKSSGIAGMYDYTYRSLGAASQYPAILAAQGITASPRNLTTAVDAPFFRDLKTGGLSAKVALTLENGWEISNIAAWKAYKMDYTFDSDFTPVNYFNRNASTGKYNQFSNELRIALPAESAFSGQFGAYYFYSKNDFVGDRGGLNGFPASVARGFPFCVGATVTAGPPPACSVSNTTFIGQDFAGKYTNESIAAFGQFTYELSDGFKLTAGGRVTHDKVALDLAENKRRYFVTLGVPNNSYTGRASNTNFSWKIGADWEASPNTLVYAFYGHGYKGPGFSNSAPRANADLSVEPEISRGGEIGLKQSFADRRVNVSVSAFHTKFDNLQVQAFNGEIRTITLTNAAKATTKGVDLNIQARVLGGLTLSAAATILDAKYDDYPGRACYIAQTTPSCTSTDPLIRGTFDVSGREVPQSAKFTAVLGADYDMPITESLDLSLGVNYYHRSRLLTDYAPGTFVPPIDTIGANLGIKTGKWRAELFCKNCFNQVRAVSAEVEPGDGNNVGALTYLQRWSWDSVRTIGLRLGMNF